MAEEVAAIFSIQTNKVESPKSNFMFTTKEFGALHQQQP